MPEKESTLILTAKDVEKIIHHVGIDAIMDEMIRRLEAAITAFDPGKTIIPVRSGFQYEKPQNGLIEWMPLLQLGDKVMMKMVGYHPENPDHQQMPTILSNIAAYDTNTGHLIGIVDGVLLTALRTGASSAVASKYMGSPSSITLGMIGCGAQAITQLHALSREFRFREILVYDVSAATVLSFKERSAVLGLKAAIKATTIDELVEAADILVTATTVEVGAGPLFEDLPTKPHIHVNAVGSDFPGKTEIPVDLLRASLVVPDFKEQAVLEGECQQLKKAEIGPGWVEVIQGHQGYRNLKKSRTVFDSTGWPLEDLVAMEMFLEYGQELGLGETVIIEHLSEDVKNPYHFLQKLDKHPVPITKYS